MPSPRVTATRSRRAAPPKPSRTRKVQPRPAISLHETWKAEQAANTARATTRTAELAASLDLEDLDERERVFLATCQMINRRNTGCTTPFEEFFHNLAFSVEYGMWPTPDDVASELEEFRRDYDDIRRDATQFLKNYPKLGVLVPAQETVPSGGGQPEPSSQERPSTEERPERDSKDWMTRTPDIVYTLYAFGNDQRDVQVSQEVQVTREEFIALKLHLGELRGFAAQEAARA